MHVRSRARAGLLSTLFSYELPGVSGREEHGGRGSDVSDRGSLILVPRRPCKNSRAQAHNVSCHYWRYGVRTCVAVSSLNMLNLSSVAATGLGPGVDVRSVSCRRH